MKVETRMPSYDVKYTRTQSGYTKTVHRRHPILFWLFVFPLALSVVLSHLWTGVALIVVLLFCAYANLKGSQTRPHEGSNKGFVPDMVPESFRRSSANASGLESTGQSFSGGRRARGPLSTQPRHPTISELRPPTANRPVTKDVEGGSSLTRERFAQDINARLQAAAAAQHSHLDVTSGDVHRSVGGYPGNSHRMPLCCSVMYQLMRPGDVVLAAPPKGQGATLRIRYRLPR